MGTQMLSSRHPSAEIRPASISALSRADSCTGADQARPQPALSWRGTGISRPAIPPSLQKRSAAIASAVV